MPVTMKRKSDSQSKEAKALKSTNRNDEDTKEAPTFHYSDNQDSLYRPPTAEEMNSLKETENLFQSSLLHMQVSELLMEVTLRKKKKKLEEILHLLNEFLIELPDGDQHNLSDLTWLPKKVHLPSPALPGTAKGTFQFFKPKSVKVIGSYLLGSLCKPQLNVDVSVQIPQECLQTKDYLNLRYHYKRAIYLAVVAAHMKKSKMFKRVEFSTHIGDMWRPVLRLTPKGSIGEKFVIKVFPSIPEDYFKLSRFSPKNNNIRHNWFYGQEDATTKENPNRDPGAPTPYYNSSMLMDMLLEKHLHFLYTKLGQHQSMIDAVVLCKVWLHQRHFDKGFQGFTGFHASMIIAYLLQTHQINHHMSSYQILRIFWQFLATKDLTTNGISMADQMTDPMPSLSEFHAAFQVVLVDPSGFLNLCANMSSTAFKQLSQEAKLALEILDGQSSDGFDILFIRKVPFAARYDQLFHVKDVEVLKTVVESDGFRSNVVDRAGDWLKVVLCWMQALLVKALGDRIHHLAIWPEPQLKWPLNAPCPLNSQRSITVGILLNADNAGVILEKGPSADQDEAKIFRQFWGEKSELRRFQDGTITEAVVWPCDNAAEKRQITEKIIKHILKSHGSIEPSHLDFPSNKLESLLKQNVECLSKTKTKDALEGGTGEENAQAVIRAFESLGKLLRNLDKLPLTINSIQGLSPVLRGTEMLPPLPSCSSEGEDGVKNDIALPVSSKKAPRWCPVSEVLVTFESSGQWPDNLEAIQRIKAAFLLNIAKLLRQAQLAAAATTKYVDVLKDGFVFRVRLSHYREMVLFQQSLEIGNLKQLHEVCAKQLERTIVRLPRFASIVHGIQLQYSSFGGSVRLAKRWVSSQMLLDYFSEECIELLVAYLYLHPAPYSAPSSPMAGFVRFLDLLSNFDWTNKVLIVNLNNELTGPEYQSIQSHFTSNRAQLPAMVIATPNDQQTSYWTKDNPDIMILKRACLLAKESYNVLEAQLTQCSIESTDFKEIFRAPLEDYDVSISLHKKQNPRSYQALDSTKALSYHTKTTSKMVLPVVNFDPVQIYLNELKDSFSEVALFFSDAYGGDVIHVAWKPSAFEPTQFKVLQSQYRTPIEKNEKLVVANIPAIISDFEVLGKGLVREVKTTDVQSEVEMSYNNNFEVANCV